MGQLDSIDNNENTPEGNALWNIRNGNYGNFHLTDAVRSKDNSLELTEGYRRESMIEDDGRIILFLVAAVTKQKLFAVFQQVIGGLEGKSVDVVLETTYDKNVGIQRDYRYEDIELTTLLSHLWDFEDLLTNDGTTGIAVLSKEAQIILDEHKLLYIYLFEYRKIFQEILESNDVMENPPMHLINEGTCTYWEIKDSQMHFSQLQQRLEMIGDKSSE